MSNNAIPEIVTDNQIYFGDTIDSDSVIWTIGSVESEWASGATLDLTEIHNIAVSEGLTITTIPNTKTEVRKEVQMNYGDIFWNGFGFTSIILVVLFTVVLLIQLGQQAYLFVNEPDEKRSWIPRRIRKIINLDGAPFPIYFLVWLIVGILGALLWPILYPAIVIFAILYAIRGFVRLKKVVQKIKE